MGDGGFRRSRLATVPLTILVFGLLSVLARERADQPEKLVGLPGTGRDAPNPGQGTTSTSAGITSTSVVDEGGPVVTTERVDRSAPRTTLPRRPRAQSSTSSTAVPPSGGGGSPMTVPPGTSPGDVPAERSPKSTVPALPTSRASQTTSPATGTSTDPSDPTTSPSPTTTTSTTTPPSTTTTAVQADAVFQHTFPSDHVGPVWIRVLAPDGARRTLKIHWGPHQRLIVHETSWAVTYAFRKDAGPTVPTTVTVSSGAGVRLTFGHGLIAPIGSVDVNDGWTTDPNGGP